ncbi:hypothetical protein EGT67_09105 [Prescottella agglutinans]|uniref:Uncharacterized protein n=1 Tax=Prescottella agglutinans TaxID=1644129 RepID=A0A3S3CZR1_9NOCA|nr:hypothetical protein [Prescottella agglutinans]RVW09619.1 hypothetical protein EGT67_09105 [Prescottella agglutinans]
MPNRTLTVYVPGWIIEDRSLDPPSVGAVMSALLQFDRRHPRAPREATSELVALARPVFGRNPVVYPDGTTRWPTILRGDGWSAEWAADRPMTGYVRLAGTLFAQLDLTDTLADQGDPVRGLVTRVRVITRPDDGREHGYLDVDVSPSRFDGHDTTGVLVDLDLGAVPNPPLRPALIPASVSAHGTDVWVLDRDLPVLVRLANATTNPVATEHALPAAILRPSAPRMRRVHADRTGCWVTGADGILRCTLEADGSLSTAWVDEGDARTSDGCDDTVLAIGPTHPGMRLDRDAGVVPIDLPSEPARLVRPGSLPVPVALPPGSVQSTTSTAGGFALLMWRSKERDYRIVTVTLDGTVTTGERLVFDEAHPFPRFAGSEHLVTRNGLWRVDRAGVERIRRLAAMPPSCGVAGDALWLVIDRRHPGHDEAAWPLDRSTDVPPRGAGQYLLAIVDKATLEVRVSVPREHTDPELAATDDGTLWMAGDALEKVSVSGTVEKLDLATLLASPG